MRQAPWKKLGKRSCSIKGQPLGGTDVEWVVTEPVCRAVELAEALHDDRQDGSLLFGRFAFVTTNVHGVGGHAVGLQVWRWEFS